MFAAGHFPPLGQLGCQMGLKMTSEPPALSVLFHCLPQSWDRLSAMVFHGVTIVFFTGVFSTDKLDITRDVSKAQHISWGLRQSHDAFLH